jgi:mRNA interferase MazF
MKYQIILVPFPFDDFSATKVRPAICLTDKIGAYNHLVIAFISSQAILANEASDLILTDTDVGFIATGLKQTSAIRLHKMVTIPSKAILRTLGNLPNSYQPILSQKLKVMFDL